MSATAILSGLGIFALGVLVGVTLLITVQVRAVQAMQQQELRPTSELLGEVTTVVPGANPVVDKILAEARADERLHALDEQAGN